MPRRFTLRALLLAILVMGVFFAWLSTRVAAKRRERAAVALVEQFGGIVAYNWQNNAPSNPQPNGPKWLRAIFGDDVFSHVTYLNLTKTNAGNDDLRKISELGLPELHFVILDATKVNDDGIRRLTFPLLGAVSLRSTRITDAGIVELVRSQKNLSYLDIAETDIGDETLAEIGKLPELLTLWLNDTQVTDVGLSKLASAKKLWHVDLDTQHLTDAGLASLKKLPALRDLGFTSPLTDAEKERIRRTLSVTVAGKKL